MNNVDCFQVSASTGGPSEKNCLTQIARGHPLKESEANYIKKSQQIDLQMLRNMEGLHAPLKICMELHSAKKVGRLPFLKSSGAQYDALTGNDELINFSDYLGTDEFCEINRNPHAFMEKYLGF